MHVFLSLSDFLVPSMTRPERTDTSVSHNALPTLRAGRTWHFTTRTTSNAERGCGDRERAAGCWTNARSESDTKRGGQLGRTAMRNKTRCDALPSLPYAGLCICKAKLSVRFVHGVSKACTIWYMSFFAKNLKKQMKCIARHVSMDVKSYSRHSFCPECRYWIDMSRWY